MKTVIIKGGVITARQELHEVLKSELSLPEWYGRNLDALYDCLTDIFEETEIIIENIESLRENLGAYADGFLSVLTSVAEKSPYITVIVK